MTPSHCWGFGLDQVNWTFYSIFVLCLFSLIVVCGQNGWEVTCTPTQICALKGSTVKIWCSYTYPTKYKGTEIAVNDRFWFTKKDGEIYTDLKTDQDYSQRVEYHCESNNNCSLKISNLTERDGRLYKFRFITNLTFGKYTGLPGVSLSVTGNICIFFFHPK